MRAEVAYRCPYCGQIKPGRFRRPSEHPHASGHGWSQSRQQVMWICHDCDRAQGTAAEGDFLGSYAEGARKTWDYAMLYVERAKDPDYLRLLQSINQLRSLSVPRS